MYVAVIALGVLAIAGLYKTRANILQIVEYPAPILRETSEPIATIDDSIVSLAGNMIATLRYQTLADFFLKQSVPRGLAAPQIGLTKRLIVCGLHGKINVMVNPEIMERKGVYIDEDDCLSVNEKGKTFIKRSSYVKVKYKTLGNIEKILVVKNDDAALVEHEIDHLNGVLNLDYTVE